MADRRPMTRMQPQPGGPPTTPRGAGGWRDWWTLLHPPYTAWHLSYVVIGGVARPARVPEPAAVRRWRRSSSPSGWPRTPSTSCTAARCAPRIPAAALVAAAVAGLAGAVALGVYGITQAGWILVPFMVAGPVLVIAYNAELFGGILHTDLGFAAAWGAFPVLTGYAAQDGNLALAAVAGRRGGPRAVRGAAPAEHPGAEHPAARDPDRRHDDPRGRAAVPLGADQLLQPLEGALRALSYGLILLAAALAVARLT